MVYAPSFAGVKEQKLYVSCAHASCFVSPSVTGIGSLSSPGAAKAATGSSAVRTATQIRMDIKRFFMENASGGFCLFSERRGRDLPAAAFIRKTKPDFIIPEK